MPHVPRLARAARTAGAPLAAALFCATLLIQALPLAAQDAQRGRLLYDNSCNECHTRSVFSRIDRIATNGSEVRAQVVRWQKNVGVPWSPTEVEDVTAYLIASAYKFNKQPR